MLAVWELGGGLGHVTRLAPLLGGLADARVRVTLLARMPDRAQAALDDPRIAVRELPQPPRLPKSPTAARTWAELLRDAGWFGADAIRAVIALHRRAIDEHRPDLIILDHAPSMAVAARLHRVPAVAVGPGFTTPPRGLRPLPDLLHRRPPDDDARAHEDIVLQTLNALHDEHGVGPIASLGELFEGDTATTLFSTFPELDHYGSRRNAHYLGPWTTPAGTPPAWPDAPSDTPRVFVYLRPYPALRTLLDALRRTGLPTVAYIPNVPPALARACASPTLRLSDTPIDLHRVAREAHLAITHAGAGATATLLVGGVPLLMIPTHLEQATLAARVERLGAGVAAMPTDARAATDGLARLLTEERYTLAAERFARVYEDHDPSEAAERAIAHLLRTLDGTEPEPS